MSRRIQVFSMQMLVLLLCVSPSALFAEEAEDPCPWVPRSGKWKLDAGKMSADGLWTPLGGGHMFVTITVEGCGDKIRMDSKDVGKVVFKPYEGSFRPGKSGDSTALKYVMTKQMIEVENLPEELKPTAGNLFWDTPTTDVAMGILYESESNNEKLKEPPETLTLFETNVYKAEFRPNVAWYLDYITQYEMYSVTTSEGVAAPPHQQFHHWTYRGNE